MAGWKEWMGHRQERGKSQARERERERRNRPNIRVVTSAASSVQSLLGEQSDKRLERLTFPLVRVLCS